MERTVLRCTTGGHNKDYEVLLNGKTVTVWWGRIGGTKQCQIKEFPSDNKARYYAVDKIHEKRDKGYTVFTHTLEPTPAPGVFSDDIRLMRDIENGVFA